MRHVFIGGLIALFTATTAFAETQSERYAQMGAQMLRAFECHHLSRMRQDFERAEQFYKIGIKIGEEHLNALLAGRITKLDQASKMPAVIADTPRDRGADFILGAIYEFSDHGVTRRLNKVLGGNWWDFDRSLRKPAMEKLYQQRSCFLLL